MSYSLDVNILVHAANTDSPVNAEAVAFLQRCATDPEPLCLTWPTIFGFLRLVTSASVFAHPRSIKEANELIEELLDLPQTRVLTEDLDFWRIWSTVAGDTTPRGKGVPDAHLAALLKQHGVKTLFTNDVDFRRFKFLKVVDPFKHASARP